MRRQERACARTHRSARCQRHRRRGAYTATHRKKNTTSRVQRSRMEQRQARFQPVACGSKPVSCICYLRPTRARAKEMRLVVSLCVMALPAAQPCMPGLVMMRHGSDTKLQPTPPFPTSAGWPADHEYCERAPAAPRYQFDADGTGTANAVRDHLDAYVAALGFCPIDHITTVNPVVKNPVRISSSTRRCMDLIRRPILKCMLWSNCEVVCRVAPCCAVERMGRSRRSTRSTRRCRM